jgi:hypothetical protein
VEENDEPTQGRFSRTLVASPHTVFSLVDWHVGLKVVLSVHCVLRWFGSFNPRVIVRCLIVSGCFTWIDDMSWTHGRTPSRGWVWVPQGSHYMNGVVLSCAYLFHLSSKVLKRYSYFDCLDDLVTMLNPIWHLRLFTMMSYSYHCSLALNYIISCVFWCVLQQNRETPTLGICQSNALFVWLISHQPTVLFSQNKSATGNQPTVLFSQNKSAPAPSQSNRHLYFSVDTHFSYILRRSWWLKSGT